MHIFNDKNLNLLLVLVSCSIWSELLNGTIHILMMIFPINENNAAADAQDKSNLHFIKGKEKMGEKWACSHFFLLFPNETKIIYLILDCNKINTDIFSECDTIKCDCIFIRAAIINQIISVLNLHMTTECRPNGADIPIIRIVF